MTAGHLLFSIATTGYILLGIYLEERDPVAAYGAAYHECRARVSILVPFLKRLPESPEQAMANPRPSGRK